MVACFVTRTRFMMHPFVVLFRSTPNLTQGCRCYCSPTADDSGCAVENSQPGLLQTWFYGVKQFGSIHINVPFNLQIESLDPQRYPDMGKLLVKLFYTPNSVNEDYSYVSLSALTKLYGFNIDTSDSSNIQIAAKFNTLATFPALCIIQMPINFDLNVECTGSRTSIQNLETNGITLKTKNSSCSLHNIKGENVIVESTDGDITCTKVVQGNLLMSVKGKGNITTERIQGQSVACSVEKGNITCSSVYSNSSTFTCNDGSINLKNNHGASKTTVNNGNLVIDSMDGSLVSHVKNGSTDLFISRTDQVSMESENGDITIKLLEESVALDLDANKVTVDEKFGAQEKELCGNKERVQGNLYGTFGKIKATAKNGNITVKSLDWMESLKLKGFD